MNTAANRSQIEKLERAFWKSIVDGKPEVATGMLTEPAVIVSGHGVTKFDHAAYTRMARDEQHKLLDYTISDMDVVFPRDDVAVASYRVHQKVDVRGKAELMDVYDTSTWLRTDGGWRCVMHTESPIAKKSH